MGAGLRRLARLRPEGVFAHRYALAIGREHDDGSGGGGRGHLGLRATLCIEGLEVLRGPLTQFLGLALGHLGPGVLHNSLPHLLDAAARGLQGDLLAQGMGISFLWQVQRCVERVQARLAWSAIAEALDLHRAEQALKRTTVQTPRGASPPVWVYQRRPDVARTAALQPALQELAEDLAAVPLDEVFSLTMAQPRCGGRE